jgi:hypothetical protein
VLDPQAVRCEEPIFVGYICHLNMDGDDPWLGEVTAPLFVIGRAEESLKIQDLGVSI